MLQTIKNTIALLALVLAVPVLSGLAVSSVSAQDIQGSLCQGAELKTAATPASCATTTAGSGDKVNSLISDVINLFSLVVGVVSVIMIIIGGFQYITSSGDSNKVGTAKNTILYAIIGLVIVALAQFIVRFVLSRVTD
jgi:cytochrome bd-type quinol oxidase subunit 2